MLICVCILCCAKHCFRFCMLQLLTMTLIPGLILAILLLCRIFLLMPIGKHVITLLFLIYPKVCR